MGDLLQTKQDTALQSKAIHIGELLNDHRGGDVVVMDMMPLDFWTDFFIIATVTSNTHAMGLEKHIKEFVRENELEIMRRSRKPQHDDDEWRLLDLGGIVIHLMTEKARSFFELERLWSAAAIVYQGDKTQTAVTAQSSKSS